MTVILQPGDIVHLAIGTSHDATKADIDRIAEEFRTMYNTLGVDARIVSTTTGLAAGPNIVAVFRNPGPLLIPEEIQYPRDSPV